MLTNTVYLDFGFNFPLGGLFVDDSLSSSVNGPAVFDTDGNTLIPLTATIENENIDLNDDGMADSADAMIFAESVLEAARRTFEPFNVVVEHVASASFTDIANALAVNGDDVGNRDAYVVVAGDSPSSNSAFGWANVDLGNSRDNTAYAFADRIIRLLRNDDNMLGVARTAAHEAGHTFGLRHTNGSAITGVGDVMGAPREGESDQRNFFVQHFMTRFDLEFQEGSGTQNNFKVLADSSVVGLKVGAPSYVTGTGAHDRITITPASVAFANALVEAFDRRDMDPADLVATGSYLVNSSNPILVEPERLTTSCDLGVLSRRRARKNRCGTEVRST